MKDERIDLAEYDFIDVGASSGGAMDYAQRKLGWGRGIGVDLDSTKVLAAAQAGRNVVQGDATKLDQIFKNKCPFAIASHFLEHLPDLAVATACLRSLGGHVSEAVFVQQPTFDFLDELAALGVKLFWADWSGHPNMMTTEMWRRTIDVLVGEEKVFESATLGFAKPIVHLTDDAIIPLTAPKNSQAYDPEKHTPKPDARLGRIMYREIKVIFQKKRDVRSLQKWRAQFGLIEI